MSNFKCQISNNHFASYILKTFISTLPICFLVLCFSFFASSVSFAETGQGGDYALPYPGILPDNPFYFLKAMRDKVSELFISNPLKRAEYDLLQSDKRVEASYMLMDERSGKTLLAESTFSKGENYFDDAIIKAQEAKRQGMDIGDLAHNLATSNMKHEEVLHNMEKVLRSRSRFIDLEQRLANFRKSLKLLRT